MADPTAPPACFSCQNQSRGCYLCNRPGFASTERLPPRFPPHGPPPHHSPYHPPPSPGFRPPNDSYPSQSPSFYPRPRPPFVNPPHLPPSGIRPAYHPQPSPRHRPNPQPGRLPHSNSPAYYWVDTMARGGVPTTAIRGGTDIDGHEIYVGRAFHEGDWLPAKIVPGRGQAYVAYGGAEHCVEQFQVLCEQRFDWVPASGGSIPPGAVEGGKTSDGESLYIGRAHHEGSLTIGKVHPSHGTCYIPFGGREIGYADYEVLVLRG